MTPEAIGINRSPASLSAASSGLHHHERPAKGLVVELPAFGRVRAAPVHVRAPAGRRDPSNSGSALVVQVQTMCA